LNPHRTLAFAVALFLGVEAISGLKAVQETDQDKFLRRFVETAKAKDSARLEEMVRRESPPLVFDAVMSQAYHGIVLLADDKEAQPLFEIAEEIAVLYARQYAKSGLVGLIKSYRNFSRDQALQKMAADKLLIDGSQLNGRGEKEEARRQWTAALKSFRELGDAASEASTLNNIGNVLESLEVHSESLAYHKQSLEISQRIGDMASETDSLNKIGVIYGFLEQPADALPYFVKSCEIARKIGDEATLAYALNNMGLCQRHLGQNEGAVDSFLQSIESARRIQDPESEARSLNQIGAVFETLGRYAEALKSYQRLLEIARATGNVEGEGSALNNIGAVLDILGQHDAALDAHRQALEVGRRIGNARGEAASLNNIGTILSDQGRYDEALSYFRQSLEIRQKIGDSKKAADSLINIGNALSMLYRFSEAVNSFEQALDIARATGDSGTGNSALKGEGNAYFQSGRYIDAIHCYQEALEICRKIGDKHGEGDALISIGSASHSLGRYSQALDCYREALEILRKTGDAGGEAGTLDSIGNVYFRLGLHSEALDYHQRSLAISQKTGDRAGQARGLHGMGNAYSGLNRFVDALDSFGRAFEIMRLTNDAAGAAYALTNMGNVHDILGHYSEALNCYQRALEVLGQSRDAVFEANCDLDIGIALVNLGEFSQALQPLKAATEIAERIDDIETVWRSHRQMGKVLWKTGRGEEAVSSYEKAVETIEKLYARSEGLKNDEQAAMKGEKSAVYQEFIQLLLELHRKNAGAGYDRRAFTTSERAKSRVFQEMMAKAGARIAFSGDDAFQGAVREEFRLIQLANNLRTRLAGELGKPEAQQDRELSGDLRTQLAQTEKNLAEAERGLDAKYPRYADLKRPQPLSVTALQEILRPGETVVSYFCGQENTLAFVVGRNSFRTVELPLSGQDLGKLVKKFRSGFREIANLEDLEKFDPGTAYELYVKIFRPIEAAIQGTTCLFVSGDGPLHIVPFEALPDKEIDVKAFREARRKGRTGEAEYLGEYSTIHFLVDSYSLAYLPSASVLRTLRKYPKPGSCAVPLIAFADPIFNEKDWRELAGAGGSEPGRVAADTALTMEVLKRSTGGMELARLPESAEEAASIAAKVGGKAENIYLRGRASEDNVFRANLNEAKYLLFSTHGLLGGDFSGVAEPSLALTLFGNPPGRDGFLSMSETLGLDLNADMVMLSACNTAAKGENVGNGEGFAGLTRSFMYAGARSLLVTHWSVESRASRDLIIETFGSLGRDNKIEAVRRAKLLLKASTRPVENGRMSLAHPFFWAAFVLVGAGE